jgi:hypothetical protein
MMPMGTRAGDEYVFAQHRKGKSGMHRVAEGIEDRGHFLIDLRVMPPNVGHGQRNEFSKGSRSIHAHAQRMRAQVPPSRQAVPAAATDHMPLAAHDVAGIEVVDVRAHLDDLPDKFVPNGHRHRNRLLRPGVPLVDMNVCATDAGISNANQNVVDSDGRLSNLFQPEASFRTALYQGFHSILPGKDGTFATPIGAMQGEQEAYFADLLFYYDDPHTIYDHWPKDVWTAVDAHQVKPGMSELETRMAIGQKMHADGDIQGDRTVTYDQDGKKWTVTYVKNRATEIKTE